MKRAPPLKVASSRVQEPSYPCVQRWLGRTLLTDALPYSQSGPCCITPQTSGSLGMGMSALTLEKVSGLSTLRAMVGTDGQIDFTESVRFTF